MTSALGVVLAQIENVDGLPFQDIGFAGLLGIVVWWLVRRVDRDDSATADEITRLRQQVEDERTAHHEQVEAIRQDHVVQVEGLRAEHTATFSAEQAAWRSEFSMMREWMNDQIAAEKALTQQKSDEKHIAVNRLAAAEGPLDMISGAVPRCDCGALDPIVPLLERWKERRSAMPLDEPPSTG